MHLTRFEINTARRGARDLLASPQRMHAAVLASFPNHQRNATTEGRVLWRVDHGHNQTLLYILSPHQPDLTHLVEQAGWPATHTWLTRPYANLLDGIDKGDQWIFRLAANPTRSSPKTPGGQRTQRYGHQTVDHQTQWLLTRAERNGFVIPHGIHDVPDLAITNRRTWKFTRDNAPVTLVTAVYEGRLEVTDPDALRRALTHGIGPAKGYGCGLLTLTKPR
ncbi:CRISPR-associated protein, Cse3 family [Alloactinosynnema sp. L-07]|uniref:type I-E CRISPR-associated protein Cas6/Cse3/CasE n=1 Tax=Alloactinosynnema sp. L-07 TaxID=1653480 RepID=UPI00065F029B|nr:type I-E CRISPR-associated protein Cas6/Cse3/CasE [Alloactinosynnema sp. L-07]CRK59255.1 CRISPR-associated protein, Cse3 family [Alloactinosynnema sp. L-07]